ncbi:MAG: 4Fe-4S binding protein [Coriobacteriia bacterium]|nr:4Fe-4S binding protein [Coriobacteriia bacterium]
MKHMNRTYEDVSTYEHWTADKFLPGGIVNDPGNSMMYITGGWRSNRPVWNKDNCNDCMLCWVHCPDSAILVENQKMVDIDFEHCKGCGMCAVECRFDAIEMIVEPDSLSAEGGN